MRIITIILLLAYSSLSIAENATNEYFCNINALKTIDYSADLAGYYQDDYDAIFPKWLAKAKSGDKKYQFYVAKAFQYGQGVAQDKKSALEWYTKSSDQGYAVAKNNLAFFYSDGEILDVDLDKHFRLLCDAASSGLSLATMNIAFLYFNLVNVNDRRVFEWMLKSSLQGNVSAQNELGILYYNGSGVEQSYKKAFEWYKRSAEQENFYAQNNLGWMYNYGEGVEQSYKKAFEWYKRSAEQGYDAAQSNLAFLYHNGFGVSVDLKKSFVWFEKSALQGNLYAKSSLAWMYEQGLGVPKDIEKALALYQLNAEAGDPQSQNNLGVFYGTGKGVPQNYEIAFSWYEKSANQGNLNAQLNLGDFYENGKGVPQNYDAAFSWYKKAAEQGYDPAQYNLGLLYQKGLGVKINFNKAVFWHKKSAEQGNKFAMQMLGIIYLNELNAFEEALKWFDLGVNAENNDSAFSLGVAYSNNDNSYYDIELAIKYLEIAYELGDRDAANFLGIFYNYGSNSGYTNSYPGLKMNIKKAEYWYLKSAKEYDDSSSQSSLANIYGQPNEYPEFHDEQKSFYWAKKSAEQSHLVGMSTLASKYEWGRGVKQSGEMAIKIYKDIIKIGDPTYSMSSLKHIGDIYLKGWTEISRDYQEAKKYFLQSEAMGDKESQKMLGEIHVALGDYKNAKKWFKKSGTKDSLSLMLMIDKALEGDSDSEFELALMISAFDDRGEVVDLYESAALKGSISAQAELGINYKTGKGVEANQEVSIYWLKKAAEQGDAMAQNNLGVLYHDGEGVIKDIDQALYWYNLAAEQKLGLSFRNLGSLYLTELNEAKKAVENYELAIEYKDYAAAWDLSYLYQTGKAGIKINEKLAFKWMLLGAKNYNKHAQFRVSRMYLDGYGVEVDEVESTIWLIRAFNMDVDKAKDPEWLQEEITKELAYRYYWGVGLERSFEKAKEHDLDYSLETLGNLAIVEKDDMTMLSIAIDYEKVAKNYKEAKYWYKKSAQLENFDAIKKVADLFRLDSDFKNAEYWYLKAIVQDDIESMEYLAFIYASEEESPGVSNLKYNPDKAFQLLVRAKNAGSITYHYDLSYLYKYGLGVNKDIEKSISLLQEMLELTYLSRDKRELAYVTLMWTYIANNINDEKQISSAMSFLIDSAKKGNTKTQVQLAELYLNERFKYFDVEEGTFWLEQAKETSFHANIILAEIYFSSNYDFNKHGESLINAIDLYESGTDINYISDTLLIDAYQNAASYFNQIGAPEKAEMLLRKSSLYFLESDQNLLDIWRKTLLAGVSSDYASSILYLENIIEENKTSEGVASSRFLNAVRLLHEKYLQGRETRKALDLAIDSMNTFSKFGTVSNQLEMMLLVSKDFIELGDYKNAKKYIELYDSFGTAGNVWTLIVKGILEIQSGGVDNGFEKINKALILVEEGSIPLRNYDLEIAIIAMQLLNQGGNYDLSASLMKKVVAFYRQGVELRIKHKSIISPYEKNQIRDAISEYIFASTKSTENLKDLGFEDMQLASGLTLSDTVIKSISKKELKGTLYIKSKLLEALNSQRRKMVEEKFEILGSSNTNLVKINIKLDDLDKKINSLERDLKGLNIDTLSAFITPLKLVKENLSEADGLITMLISNQRSYVWLTTKEGVFRHDSELTLSDVKKHSTQLLNALNPSSVNNNSFPIESSSKLYDLLIKPFEVELKGIDRLIFSPDPVLSQIPFSVLTKSGSIGAEVVTNSGDLRGVATVKINSLDMTNTNLENVEWLIEDFAVAIVPSIYSYVGLEASNEEEFGALNSFLGIGNPTLSGSEVVFKSDISVAMSDQRGSISRTLSDLSALPETETELNIIANYFSSSEIITQGNATEAKIRDMDLSGIEVIAFATHALVSNEIDDLLEPAIVLTPVDSDNPDNDGLLMASEVAKLNMDADIVLLSACNTASSFDESNSQGLSGLADSFFEAGAKSILASYWSVISDSAVEITTKMFDKSNTGRSYSHKHRESILKILEESNSYKSNPVYWAPFMVVGVN